MKNRGFKEIYQIDGGIVRYGEKYGDKELWKARSTSSTSACTWSSPRHCHHRQVRTVRARLE